MLFAKRMEAWVTVKEVCNFINLKHIRSGVYARVGNHEGSFFVAGSENKRMVCAILSAARFEAVCQQWPTTNEKNYTKRRDTCLFNICRAIIPPVKDV